MKVLVEEKIERLKKRGHNSRKRKILQDQKCRKVLEELHSKYVFVPADKASNNVVIICKDYYKEVLRKELGQTNTTYASCQLDAAQLVNQHLVFMRKVKLNVPSEMQRLPSFYWMPKLHKSPYGQRFIAASSACTTKPLSKLLTRVLQLVLTHYKEYCAGIERRTGVNCFWVVGNSSQVLDQMRKIHRACALDSFDFSTLYTNIPHTQLKQRMEILVRKAYTTRRANHIVVNRDRAYWSSERANNGHNLTADDVTEFFNYLIDNIYIQVGDIAYRQTIGIPMGTDCAPLVADLFLFSYEYEFMKEKMRTDLSVASKFSRTCRYIDDLLSLNNSGFEASVSEIYPPELELKRTTESPSNCSYLDLNIQIADGKFTSELYDKRDAFHFEIINFPHMDSNIPSKPAYGVVISQLVRYQRVCCSYHSFVSRSHVLTARLLRQGYRYDRLCSTVKKFVHRYPHVLQKYQRCLKDIITDCVALPINTISKFSKHITHRQKNTRQ